MTSTGSVTGEIRSLEDVLRREEAAAQLWRRYFALLTRQALAKLRVMGVPRGSADEEDVAARAFARVCRDIEIGRIRLESRDDLVRLLILATNRGAINLAQRAERDAGPGGEDSFLFQVAGPEGSPESDFLMRESIRELLDSLNDEDLRRIVLWKLQSHTNEEIAQRLGCSMATVERMIKLARARLGKHPGQSGRPAGLSGPPIEIGDKDENTTAILNGMDGRPG